MKAAVILCLLAILFPYAALSLSCANARCTVSDSLPPDSLHAIKTLLTGTQKEIHALQSRINELEEEANNKDKTLKRVHFGLSLGYRWLDHKSKPYNTSASISPIDSSLRITRLAATSFLISTCIVFDCREKSGVKSSSGGSVYTRTNSPKNRKRSLLWKNRINNTVTNMSIIANINILDFSNGQKELAFNKSIEGGLGLGYRLNDKMYFGFGWELLYTWQLYDDVKLLEGKQLRIDGAPVTSSNQIPIDDKDLYYRRTLSGWSVKVVVCL